MSSYTKPTKIWNLSGAKIRRGTTNHPEPEMKLNSTTQSKENRGNKEAYFWISFYTCEKTRITDLYFANDLLFSPMGAFNLNNFETIIWTKECVGVLVVIKNKWIWAKKRQLLQTGREDVFVRLQFNIICDLLSCFDILRNLLHKLLRFIIFLPNRSSFILSQMRQAQPLVWYFSYKHTETRCSHTVKSTQNIFLERIKGSQSQVWFWS